MINLKGFVLIILLLSSLISCEEAPDEESLPPPPPGVNLSVTPGKLEITILSPAVDGTPLSPSSQISGHCGIPGYPIVISGGGKKLLSICQEDYSWHALPSVLDSLEDSITFSAKIQDKLLSQSSPVVVRTFTKKDNVCLITSNRSKLFANIDLADGELIPFKICTPKQFSNIRFYPDKKFEIAQNIDFTGMIISPIAIPFKGELDGQGFYLKNFLVKDAANNGIGVGLFKYAHNAAIRNLNIKDAKIEGYSRVGILAGDWRGGGIIENVKVHGEVKAITMAGGLIGIGNTSFSLKIKNTVTDINVSANDYVGGVISLINSRDGSFSIENSEFRGNVSGNSWIGGVAGRIDEKNLLFSQVTQRGQIRSFREKVGGFVGEMTGGTLSNVSQFGSVSTTSNNTDTFVGGLIGLSTNYVSIRGAKVVSTISSEGNFVAGLVGRFYSGLISDVISRVKINIKDSKYNAPQKFVGGIIGSNALETNISDSHAIIDLNTDAYYVGGLAGNLIDNKSTIHRSWSQGVIHAKVSHIGGLVGNFGGSSITESFSQTDIFVTGPTPNTYLGGLVGLSLNSNSKFRKLYFSGDITVQDGTADKVGGVFGHVRANSIRETFATGTLSGARSQVGGIAGYLWSNLDQSFFSGSIKAKFRYTGGLSGVAYQSVLKDNFVFSDNIISDGESGGLVGWLAGESTLAQNYFTGSLTKRSSSQLQDKTIGPVIGISDPSSKIEDTFYDSSKRFTDEGSNRPIAVNNSGLPLTPTALSLSQSYTNFNFNQSSENFYWKIPASGFKLPFKKINYAFAVQNWITIPNYGLPVPVTYSDDPEPEINSDIFESHPTSMNSVALEQVQIFQETLPPQTLSPGSLQISILSPEKDGAPISTKLLLHGECGIPGGKISLYGAFTMKTICQHNFRWAAVLDATLKPDSNLIVEAQLHSLSQVSRSPVVRRILKKSSSICSDSILTQDIFANINRGGNGKTVPYQICNPRQFRNIAYYPNASFELSDHIDFVGNTFSPIKSSFKGQIDGNNFSIKNLIIEESSGKSVGLFSSVQDATLKNITFENFTVSGYQRVAAIAGDWRGLGEIENVVIKNISLKGIESVGILAGLTNTESTLSIKNLKIHNATIEGNNNTGGLIGFISSTNGYFHAQEIDMKNISVQGINNVGGFIGLSMQPDLQILNLQSFKNRIKADGKNIGGLLGNVNSSTLSDVFVKGEITTSKNAIEISVGGIAGQVQEELKLKNIHWKGPITSGSDNVGGIAGKVNHLRAHNINSEGLLTIKDTRYNSVRKNIGGLVGLIQGDDSILENSSSTMNLETSAQYVGGLVGKFEGENSVIKNAFYSGNLHASTSYVGGLVGIFDGATFSDSESFAKIKITNPTPNANIGGLLGYANSKLAKFKNLRSYGDISILNGSADYVGGLIGFFRAGSLTTSLATGNVTGGRNSVGGLVGMMRGGVDYSYSMGSVTAYGRHIGGLVGYLNLQGFIRDSFTMSNVIAAGGSGGLVGIVNTLHGLVSVENSYAFGEVIPQNDLSADEDEFGPIYGVLSENSSIDENSVFYLNSKTLPNHNNIGTGLDDDFALEMNSYTGFDFVSSPGWRKAAPFMIVPGYGKSYPYPILDWIFQLRPHQ